MYIYNYYDELTKENYLLWQIADQVWKQNVQCELLYRNFVEMYLLLQTLSFID